jgi:hypothetical protein
VKKISKERGDFILAHSKDIEQGVRSLWWWAAITKDFSIGSQIIEKDDNKTMDKEQIIQITILPGGRDEDSVILRKYNSEYEKDIDSLIEFLGYFIPQNKFLDEYRGELLKELDDHNNFRFYKLVKNMAKRCLKSLENKG